MASTLSLWEVDPFFPAAEEVQNSTDRMESIFRAWKSSEGAAQATPEDTSLLSIVDINKRDLVTALDTVRWQLEEFTRAVEMANLGEDSKSRHSQFVKAIQSQVCNIESELGDALWDRKYRRLEEADSRCLEHFLSGGLDLDCDLDVSGTSLQREEPEPEISSSPSVAIRIDIHDECMVGENNGFHIQNGETFKRNGLTRDSTIESSKSGKQWNFWRFWQGPSKLQLSSSGLKRWKDGDTSFLDRAEECISSLRHGFMEETEQGKSGRKVNSSCSYSPPSDRIERRLQRAHQLIPIEKTVLTMAAVVVIGLMGLYCWFLTALVPFDDDQPVPGHFLH